MFGLLSAGTVNAAPGNWKQLGPSAGWKNTITGAVLNNKLYTVEKSGQLYVTDINTGKWQKLGKGDFVNTKFIFPASGVLYTIETNGSLFKVNPSDGSWVMVGKAGDWKDTISGAVLNNKLYSVESSGALYETNVSTGTWKQIGKSEFQNTKFIFVNGDNLFTIETDGSLYKVNPSNGNWVPVGKPGVWKNTVAGATLGGKLYTIENTGFLFVTETGNGAWKNIGKNDFKNENLIFGISGNLYSINDNGNLYRIEVK